MLLGLDFFVAFVRSEDEDVSYLIDGIKHELIHVYMIDLHLKKFPVANYSF